MCSTLTYSSRSRLARASALAMALATRCEIVIVPISAPGPRTDGRFLSTASSAVTSALGATPARSSTRGTKPSS